MPLTPLSNLQMSDFLVDEDTASRAVDLLGQVVVPSHTAMVGKRRFFDSAPSELQRESVQKVCNTPLTVLVKTAEHTEFPMCLPELQSA